ncbi:hypothetical protein [Anaeromyxobacter sp. Fw109-5]|uniref:hypothetical protein n=1 Tax=Anaeromyxobacter sp. (strain Fw109-5) TaxID=404589 RepID=UPI000158A731|nr:hypothetical protein [Anaeromyxobacter sp. Fw109-5]ABS27723.1 hypothetical protein Anae109_3542 [Anaeromyxobacter sp. Fw109-5]
MRVSWKVVAAVSLTALALSAFAAPEGKPDVKILDLSSCDPTLGGFTLDSENAYFPIDVGLAWTYEGEEGGEEVRLVITVLDETESVAGVTTRVVEEREWSDGVLVEVSRNFYAAREGTICYFGEDVDLYDETGVNVVSHEGAWRAGVAGARPGIFMPAEPWPGVRFPMELAPGIAEDQAKVVGIGPVTVPFGTFGETIRLREYNPLDGDKGFKVFAAGVGMIVDGPAELVDLVGSSP